MLDSKILVIIAARGGSKGVKNKNIRMLQNQPLISYSITQAKKWGMAEKIICSTDSAEIAAVARQYGALVPFMRPAELATDSCGKIDALKHAVENAERLYQERYSLVVDLDATAPARKTEDLEGMRKLFIEKKPKSMFSVTPARKNPYFNMVEVGPDGFAVLSKKPASTILSRQAAPGVYDMNASIYFYDRDFLMDPATRIVFSDRSLIWIMDELSSVDVDTEMDFQFLEFLLAKGLILL